ncbi:hypothetical protein Btru_008196 [Bulinus truncatus]|nr:hypothetical protein Btru_008196 [Bulinus truncatus]
MFYDTDSPLKLTCTSNRTETVFPAIRHSDGFNSTAQQSNDVLLLLLKWRRMNHALVLHPNEVTLPQTHSEWTRDSITYAKFPKRRCLYSGYVKGQSSSHAALSLCSGVSGYIQTDTELLFVQPKGKNSLMVGPSAHVLYTCEPKRSPSNLEMSTPDSHERHRRSTQKSKYLEVALVVENGVVEKLGSKDKAFDYIMMQMSILHRQYLLSNKAFENCNKVLSHFSRKKLGSCKTLPGFRNLYGAHQELKTILWGHV